MDRFSKLNPRVSLLFFAIIIVVSLALFNPIYLLVSLMAAFLYSVKLNGKSAVKSLVLFVIPVILFTGVFNMIFTSYGDTVLFNVFKKDFTLEGFFYGVCTGLSLGCLIMWISCYSSVMTTDRLLSAFSRIAPDISLTLSMILAFLPRLKKNALEINDARFLYDSEKNKLKKSLNSFSALVSLTLEESIELAESMKARGFNKNRKAYSRYAFTVKDALIMLLMIVLTVSAIAFKISGKAEFIFEPKIYMVDFSPLGCFIYATLCFLPLIIDATEDLKWLYIKSKT